MPNQSGNVVAAEIQKSEVKLSPDACRALIENLPKMNRPELQALWIKLFGRPPHPKLRRQLMVPILAYRAQERTYGGLKAATRKYLHRLALQIESGEVAKLPQRIKPGTKLIRQWHGATHEVLVAAHGFHYRGVEYRTLSEIAELITGAHWSGPAFFGLRKRAPAKAAHD